MLMKIVCYILFFIFFSCSDCYNTEVKRSGLYGDVECIKKISFRVVSSTDGLSKLDTLSIRDVEYDSIGLLRREYLKFQFDKYSYAGNYFYNPEDLLIKEIGKMSNQQNEIVVDYFYKEGKIVSTRGYLKENSGGFDVESFQIENYFYSKERLIQCKQDSFLVHLKDNDTTYVSGYTSKFDHNKLVIEVDWKVIDSVYPMGKSTYIRDCKGLVVKEVWTDKVKGITKVFKYKYEYDETGNWIERRKFKNDSIKSIVKRIIEYRKF